jgi:DEAD/DEAH box helicase domain-containing protein
MVTHQVVEFRRKQLLTDTVLSVESLDLPEEELPTAALWIVIPPDLAAWVESQGLDLAGGIHAIEHAAIGLLPLFAMCDRWDIGGVSYPLYPDTGQATIFIYDGHRGGVGVAEKGYEVLDELLRQTLDAIRSCPCEAGCPSCIQSPKCGNLNAPLDKQAAIVLLERLLAGGVAASAGAGPLRR